MKCPVELQQSNLEIVLTEDQERDAQRQVLQVSLRYVSCLPAAACQQCRGA